MTKKTVYNTAIIVIGLIVFWYMFIYEPKKFDTKPYETKIESLQKQIDSVVSVNDTLETELAVLEQDNDYLAKEVFQLTNKVDRLKGELKKAKGALSYTPTQVDSFFVANYSDEYKKKSKDTTHLPLQVSKAVIVDLKEGAVNEKIVSVQDSIIKTQEASLDNRDKAIDVLRQKEANYQTIISKQTQQADNYKIQIDGLKNDIKKSDRRVRMSKIQKAVLGAVIIGLAVTK